MATDGQNAATALSLYWGIIATLDAVPIAIRALMTYTDDNGRSFDWNGYRESIMRRITELQGAGPDGSSLVQKAQGPFTVWG